MKRNKILLRRYFSSNNIFNKNIKNGHTHFLYNKIRNNLVLKKYVSSSIFDVFDKIKDSNNKEHDESTDENVNKKRKPSKKVLKLVDEILNLTLIEAADLCDLCQEKLEGNQKFNNSFFINRNPFPHPSNFFGANQNMFPPPTAQNAMNLNPNVVNDHTACTTDSTLDSKEEKSEKKKNEDKKNTKSTFNVKLEKFDVKNKINTIKEIRKITNVGLKEAKDMVESAPFYIQKNVPSEKAEEMKKSFEQLGATIILE
ncbi:putative mitochondrial ribosomal protein L12 precursor [Plasmodium gaboni]|uniref:Mitochondrial ribosomal protein L12, putative n=1 Tax=Plasmodium gaboni TaxID=647221 RepID=A0A151LWI5_9APIC|nr:putative mitochondrial ribosomal protein L12 precursor [Plasmodium gaboni]KYO03554.1 putative mitochondrial ribosomal protein L12 precursor [Plasmodium gaboni]SOV10397.1 mitochondrial ribosomal protein L12 precursor, putative [Plasmodium gaboni]